MEFIRKLAIQSLESKFEFEYNNVDRIFTSPGFSQTQVNVTRLESAVNSINAMKSLFEDFKKVGYTKMEELNTKYGIIVGKFVNLCNVIINNKKDEIAEIEKLREIIWEQFCTN